MSKDISQILAGWEFVPDSVSVRVIAGGDGREKIQMRLDLGLIQMEFDGRPDGQRPEGHESWLEYYEHLQSEAAMHGDEFQLDAEQCGRLLREGVQYYHRYLSFWNLQRYELCARDTERNLRLFAFVKAFAAEDKDKLQFDQWRPYVTMMHTRAMATPLVESRKYTAALAAVDDGMRAVRKFLEEYRQAHRAEQCGELAFLQRWRDEIEDLRSQAAADGTQEAVDRLRCELEKAVAAENFEEAARLRDEIQRQGGSASSSPDPCDS